MSKILLAYYGDDFTGSTDALEFLCRAGAKAVLFIEPPTAAQLKSFPQLDAYGIAGKTRALNPAEMEEVLLTAFALIKENGARHVHYKVCSTYDSSPTVGSIGKAIDCGATIFEQTMAPVIGGNPALGRYCVFGNLFARMGIGSNGKIYRIDRHPSMSKHPVTPADESDLRLHLGKQTNKTIGLIDMVEMQQPINKWRDNKSEQVLLLDTTDESELPAIGEWMDGQVEKGNLFSVGGSAVEMALGSYWNHNKTWIPVANWPAITVAKPLLVVSGSCSPVTATQIAYAKANGFVDVVLDVAILNDKKSIQEVICTRVNSLLLEKQHVIVHTGAVQTQLLSSEILGNVLGYISKLAAEQTGIKRIVVSGGDTSSYTARAMGIDAVEMIAPLVAGAPLCKAHSRNKAIQGLEVNFKGGQVGAEDYFVLMAGEKL
ncbi:MAG: four-carbon acid sugar kinase family protein [Chitinophagaceae bacterium]